jgi:linoleoyl-CoA desaturase
MCPESQAAGGVAGVTAHPRFLSDEQRLRLFGGELDALKRRALARVGADDVAHVKRVDRFSRTMEVVGRVLIHVSPEPFTFMLGVGALWLHKQLQATEIGHTALHGCYDKLAGAEKFRSGTFKWDTPIDEQSWRHGHNVRHHGNTNVAGKDPDIHFGTVRLTVETPYSPRNRHQLLTSLLLLFPNFTFVMASHFAGLNDVFVDNGLADKLDFLPDRSRHSVLGAWKRALRKYVPYYLREYAFFPLLAGPFFWKVMLGNFLASLLRDVYTAATIFCGHVGEDVKSYPEGTKAHGRGAWYAMQAEASNDFDVPRPISILCGGLDLQIEHHMFPTLPPERLREIAPEVRAICEKYGVAYKTDTWGRTLGKALRYIDQLSSEGGALAVVRAMA